MTELVNESQIQFSDRLAEDIKSMPILTQGIIELRYVQGFDLDFIADELGVSEAQATRLAKTALVDLFEIVTNRTDSEPFKE